MKSISFDNPYLLLIAVPALLILLVSFFIAFRKDNRSKSSVFSLILHIVIICLVSLGIAGMIMTTVVSETNVYIVADVSYSSDRKLDLIDDYIQELEGKLPGNSKVGVICFGKNAELLYDLGEDRVSVKESNVDRSATNIASALNLAGDLFREDVIKRVVLITDGKQTDAKGSSALVEAVEKLYLDKVYIDAIYVDANITSEDKEVQVTGVDFTRSTYLNHESSASVIIQSSYDAEVIAKLYLDGKEAEKKALTLTRGISFVDFDLVTDKTGTFDYEIVIEKTDDEADACIENNRYSFTHTVSGVLNVLLVSSNPADEARVRELFGTDATIDAYVNRTDVPYTVEAICKYDEIVISDVDVRELDNFTAFIDAVDKAVSDFGKSLVTLGDLKIQNKTDDVLKQLEDMLPVRFGKVDNEPALFGFVIDTSRSMQLDSRLLIAKEAMRQMIPLLNPNDYVVIIFFSGEATVAQAVIKVEELDIEENINKIDPSQGTFIGTGLKAAFDRIKQLPYYSKQVLLMSDGASFTGEPDDPESVAAEMFSNGITVSTLATNPKDADNESFMESIAANGGGSYYYVQSEEDVKELVLSDIADDVFQSIVELRTEVNIELENDPSLDGVIHLPTVQGYVNSRSKASAYTVLTMDYKMPSGKTLKSPLYSWWNYGNGRVSSFTSKLSGDWSDEFFAGDGSKLIGNAFSESIPEEKISYPYNVSLDSDGLTTFIEMTPATVIRDAVVTMEITLPNGEVLTEELALNGSGYSMTLDTVQQGKYKITVNYSYYGESYVSEIYFNVCYGTEYDCFASFDPAALHDTVRHRGRVSEGKVPTLVNDESDMDTYEVSFTPAFMIAAIALYVIDIIIRKLKWRDVVSFFRIKR